MPAMAENDTANDEPTFEAWLLTRPECVQRLAREFPPMSVFSIDDEKHWLIGWTEDDQLIVSPVNPQSDYDGSRHAKKLVCAEHFR